uniref:MARVEL domain-containing protein n=1 Tax=Parastrongyloides trichosuri TaxID=131310 RepID=A0A0N5A6B2_PARTI
MARKGSFQFDDLDEDFGSNYGNKANNFQVNSESQNNPTSRMFSELQNNNNSRMYESTTYSTNDNILEYDQIECTPNMCANPYVLLRFFELAGLFAIHWLTQIVCGRDDCTMIINEFGYRAHAQGLVLAIDMLLAVIIAIIITCYSLNAHKAYPNIILTIEKIHGILGFVLLIICGIIGSIYAAQTAWDIELNEMGRAVAGIRPQWIAAACLEFVFAFVYLADFIGQRREGYPFSYSISTAKDRSKLEAIKRQKMIREHKLRQQYY